MTRVEVQHGAATDVGLVREANEDAYLAEPPVFVVADGMGGHESGDVASAVVVEEFGRLADGGYDPERGAEAIARTLRACQGRIAAYAEQQRARGAQDFRTGTTAVVALLVEDEGEPRWLLANLGDSRAYRFRDGELEQVSVDHSVVQELLDAGAIGEDDVAQHPERHVITRALGATRHAEADFFLLPLDPGERLLLCSDGVNGMIDDATIAGVLAEHAGAGDAAAALVGAAVAAGGRDNATAVVVDVVGWAGHDAEAPTRRVSLEDKLGALP